MSTYWPPPYYRQDNTDGYTDEELRELNEELCEILAEAIADSDDQLSADEANEIIQQHMDEVAGR